jgi:hypothetical protein
MGVDEDEARAGAPVAEQARLDVRQLQIAVRAEERVIFQEDHRCTSTERAHASARGVIHTGSDVVGRAPELLERPELGVRQHGSLLVVEVDAEREELVGEVRRVRRGVWFRNLLATHRSL